MHLQRNDSVPIVSMARLLGAHRVHSLRYLKLDVEGYELRILQSLESAAQAMPSLWPHLVAYERKWLTHDEKLQAAYDGASP